MAGLLAAAAAPAAAATAGVWFIPMLAAALSYYQFDKTDPEGRPKDTKVRNHRFFSITIGDIDQANRLCLLADHLQILRFHRHRRWFGRGRGGQSTQRTARLECASPGSRRWWDGNVGRSRPGRLPSTFWTRLAVQIRAAPSSLSGF